MPCIDLFPTDGVVEAVTHGIRVRARAQSTSRLVDTGPLQEVRSTLRILLYNVEFSHVCDEVCHLPRTSPSIAHQCGIVLEATMSEACVPLRVLPHAPLAQCCLMLRLAVRT